MGSEHPLYVIRLLIARVHQHPVPLAQQARMTSHHTRQKKYGPHSIARAHNIARTNCRTRTHSFPKQTKNWLKNGFVKLQIATLMSV